jgi:hypothetical protein
MKQEGNARATLAIVPGGGLAGWLLERLRRSRRPPPRLELLEAEGRLFLVATSPEGAPAFYALDERPRPAVNRPPVAARPAVRVSW